MRDACFLHPFCLFHFGYSETILSYSYCCMMLFSPAEGYTTIQSSLVWIVFYHAIVPRQVLGTYLQTEQTMRATPSDRYLGGIKAKVACYIPKFIHLSYIGHVCFYHLFSSGLSYFAVLFAFPFLYIPQRRRQCHYPSSFSSASSLNKPLTRI